LKYKRYTLLLIGFASLARILIALCTELGNDEVYYRLYADPLQWNYFDHPPMVGWLIRLSTLNLYFDTGFTIRLGAIVSGAGVTWLMYRCGKLLASEYAGFLAAVLYTASIYGSIIAGTFILPDSPQMLCWVGSLFLLIKITHSKVLNSRTAGDVLWFGVLTGLGMLCKVHTIFLWFGFGLYILFYCRDWLQHWSIYTAAFIAVLLFMPVLIWNVQNDFITYTFHSKRVDVSTGGFNTDSFLSFLGGQFFYCNPVVFFLIARALWHRDLFVKTAHKRILLLAALPMIILATGISLFKDLLPHWTGPGFISLIPLTAAYFAKKTQAISSQRLMPAGFTAALMLIIAVAGAGTAGVYLYPGTLGEKGTDRKGDGDFTLDMYGWRKFAVAFDSIYHSKHLQGAESKTIILADKWFPAANIDFYVARPLKIQTVALGPIEDIHQYYWLNRQRGLSADSCDIYVISPSNYFIDKNKFAVLQGIQPVQSDTIIQYRNKVEARRFYLYYYQRNKYSLIQPRY